MVVRRHLRRRRGGSTLILDPNSFKNKNPFDNSLVLSFVLASRSDLSEKHADGSLPLSL